MSEAENATRISVPALIRLMREEGVIEPENPLTGQCDLFACGMDSLAMMRLMILIERDFGIRIPAEQVTRDRFASADALAEWLGSLHRPPFPV
ncbi:MAG TPA: hypothetical protein DIT64_08140 [Verrucomicrobiales bacterium]|nr:hypothetical protein [Verrucomicrobiales bacterium]HRJ08270.1 phosphopantetheine-binding protein [Prosthecobacter sp.]HRK16633.1 phosphopantetheine-binding protein [Prosthecobacter sp.]